MACHWRHLESIIYHYSRGTTAGHTLGVIICRYLRGNLRLGMSAEALGEHNLSLFTWESKAWHTVGIIICRCSRRNRRLGMSLEALESIICRYLRGNLRLGIPWSQCVVIQVGI